MRTEQSLELDQLGDTYEIIGEIGGHAGARSFIARTRDGGRDVLIVVSRAPEGDQGNALNHLAADAKQLGSGHPNLLAVLDARWLGTDAFAVVHERTWAPTLEELLSRRDEEFSYSRIAAILSEVNGVIEWARAAHVVHRRVLPETLFVEPGTDRVRVAFVPRALPTSGAPGAEADGSTIAALARAMLTRSPMAPERAEQPLAELRPGLPKSVIESTDALLNPSNDAAQAPDLAGYIASIAMAEALKAGEEHMDEARRLIEEQQQQHREQIEKERSDHEAQLQAERTAHEKQVADQAKKFAKEREDHEGAVAEQAKKFAKEREEHERAVAEQAKRFAKEREDFERQLAKERATLAKEREEFERQLAKERAKFAKEREAFARERAAHAQDVEELKRERAAHSRDRAALLQERAQHERLAEEQREALRNEARELESQAQLYAATAEFEAARGRDVPADATAPDVSPVVPSDAVAREDVAREIPVSNELADEVVTDDAAFDSVDDETAAEAEIGLLAAPPVRRASAEPAAPAAASSPTGAPVWRRAWTNRPAWARRWKREWSIPAGAIGLVLLIGITAVALSRRSGADTQRPAAQVVSSTPSHRVVDSAAGNVQSVVPLPTMGMAGQPISEDSLVRAQAAADSAEAARQRRIRAARRAAAEAAERQREAEARFVQEQERQRRVDTAGGAAPFGPIVRDTVRPPAPDTLRPPPVEPAPVKRDSVPKVDSIPRRDTLPMGAAARVSGRRGQ